ncbi:hypothetical protein [Oceanobacillus piezotolerans]|nr:hypothetical protein [Oceanobacillus piezotolerans]
MTFMIVFIAIILVVAVVATFIILKQEETKMKTYEEEGETVKDELKRSHEYESSSLSKNVKNLSWIYAIVTIMSFVVLAIYIYYR